jgi:hypothetical protein
MFIMLGYDGEEVSDIEATADYLKQANPDLFLTTVAYPIKGTAYYEEVADRVATPLDWAERTDRDLQVNGRYSRQFYDHATRWLVNEVNLHQAWQAGQRHPLRLGKLWLNAQRGRWGMRLTRHQRETGQTIHSSGRGWPAPDRASERLVDFTIHNSQFTIMPSSSAFDAFAADYDATFTHTALGQRLRRRVWRVLADYFQAGQTVLELACGTGEDAVWLAQRGLTVTATDGSAEMVRATAVKAQQNNLSHRITPHTTTFSQRERLLRTTHYAIRNTITPSATSAASTCWMTGDR